MILSDPRCYQLDVSRDTVIAIDPGSEKSGIAGWDGEKVTVIHDAVDNRVLLSILRSGIWDNNLIVCERVVSYNQVAGADVIDTVLWSGRFLEVFEGKGLDNFILVPRRIVKAKLLGKHTTNDSDVRNKLLELVGPQGKKSAPGPMYNVTSHAAQALAIAYVAKLYPADIKELRLKTTMEQLAAGSSLYKIRKPRKKKANKDEPKEPTHRSKTKRKSNSD